MWRPKLQIYTIPYFFQSQSPKRHRDPYKPNAFAVMLAAQNELQLPPKASWWEAVVHNDFFLILSLGYQILIRGGQKMSSKQEVSYVWSFQMIYGL